MRNPRIRRRLFHPRIPIVAGTVLAVSGAGTSVHSQTLEFTTSVAEHFSPRPVPAQVMTSSHAAMVAAGYVEIGTVFTRIKYRKDIRAEDVPAGAREKKIQELMAKAAAYGGDAITEVHAFDVTTEAGETRKCQGTGRVTKPVVVPGRIEPIYETTYECTHGWITVPTERYYLRTDAVVWRKDAELASREAEQRRIALERHSRENDSVAARLAANRAREERAFSRDERASRGDTAAIKEWLAAGSLEYGDRGPFSMAILAERFDVVRLFLALGAQPTWYHGARVAAGGSAKMLELVLTAPGFPTKRGKLDEPLLPLAAAYFRYPAGPLEPVAEQQQLDLIRFLLTRGESVNVRDLDKRTPLIQAARYGRVEAARVLLDAGADINARDGYGTALWLATAVKDKAMMDLLLARGAAR